ncbi:probable aspartic protease At2g35615 [Zingiber officinale]|uniref:probable aspartic protease At2g35615 n=1 Tax=Zingiber officinale TaxID=94328 RepID=UPI001C4B6A9B|nr:probable aspartic protease At2g35615 [Zingiber officinale]
MAAISTIFRLLLLISFVPSLFSQDTVFDVELVHRDSPMSPLYNNSMTPFDHLQAAVVRSVNRASYFDKRIDMNTSIDIELGLTYNTGEFLMRFGMGTPNMQSMLGFIDTGSYLNWVDCAGCQCFNLSGDLFYPSESLSYKKLSCYSNECNNLGRCNKDKMCQYHVTFGDDSNIDGIFSSETLSFTSLDTNQITFIPNILFGCNLRSLLTKFHDPGSSIGLGPNSPSLIHQLAPKYISKYFSYCLDYLNGGVASRLFLGRGKQTITGTTMVTPLMTQDNFYAVQLNAISIPQKFAVFLPTRSKLRAGNIIFDSGTVMTVLDTEVVDRLVRELTNYVSLPTVKVTGPFKLCFNVFSTEDEDELPGLWFSFAGTLGNFWVGPENLFGWYNRHVKCMVIIEANGLQVFGNIMQQDVLVGHDLDKMELTIIEKKCTELYKP